MVHFTSIASLVLLSASAAIASHAGEPVVHRRGVMGHSNNARMEHLHKRQNITEPTTTPADTPAVTTTPPANDAKPTTSSSSDPLAPILGGLTGTTTPAAATTLSSTTPPAGATTSTTPLAAVTTSAKGKASTSSAGPSSSKGIVTQTSTVPLSSSGSSAISSSASSSVSAEPAKSGSSSSGINHATLIVIIVVASSVAGIAAIWTIIRKTKFSPSRRFEAKLEPIDFVPGKRDTFDGGVGGAGFGMLNHDRSGSSMGGSLHRQGTYAGGPGYAASLARSDSGGKSLRQEPMSQVSHMPGSIPYNAQPSYGHQPYYPQGSAVGYAQEQSYGYGDVQRGLTVSSRGGGGGGGYGGPGYPYHGSSNSIAAASQGSSAAPAYDYAAQQRGGRY